jgi:hypothetical protein
MEDNFPWLNTAGTLVSRTTIVPTTANRLGKSRYQELIDRLMKSGISASTFLFPEEELAEHSSNNEQRALEDLKSNISAAVLAQLFPDSVDGKTIPASCSRFGYYEGKLDIHLEELKLDCLIPIPADAPAWAVEEMGVRFFAITHLNDAGQVKSLSALVKRPLWKTETRTPNCPFGRAPDYFSWRATAKGLPTLGGSEGTQSAEVACLLAADDSRSVALPVSDQDAIADSVYWHYIHESEYHV